MPLGRKPQAPSPSAPHLLHTLHRPPSHLGGTAGPCAAPAPPLQGQPAEGTCLEFVEQQLQDLGGGHGAVDADVGDGAVGWREHRCLSIEGDGLGWQWGQEGTRTGP